MRYLLPVVAAATALTIGIAPAAASRHAPAPAQAGPTPTSPCTSPGTPCSAATASRVHGKVRPAGRHRVKVVFRGPDAKVLSDDQQGRRELRPALVA